MVDSFWTKTDVLRFLQFIESQTFRTEKWLLVLVSLFVNQKTVARKNGKKYKW